MQSKYHIYKFYSPSVFSFQLNDDYKVIFLLQNLRLLNGKDITKLANQVRRVNSRKLTSKVRCGIFP